MGFECTDATTRKSALSQHSVPIIWQPPPGQTNKCLRCAVIRQFLDTLKDIHIWYTNKRGRLEKRSGTRFEGILGVLVRSGSASRGRPP
jgi:hypothetical protein